MEVFKKGSREFGKGTWRQERVEEAPVLRRKCSWLTSPRWGRGGAVGLMAQAQAIINFQILYYDLKQRRLQSSAGLRTQAGNSICSFPSLLFHSPKSIYFLSHLLRSSLQILLSLSEGGMEAPMTWLLGSSPDFGLFTWGANELKVTHEIKVDLLTPDKHYEAHPGCSQIIPCSLVCSQYISTP